MRNYIVGALVIFLMVSACSKTKNTNNIPSHDCKISLPALAVSADGSVVYNVSATGSAKVDKITYWSTDSVTIDKPTLPFNKTVSIVNGNSVRLDVTGTTSSGTITASYSFTPTGSSTSTSNSQQCSE